MASYNSKSFLLDSVVLSSPRCGSSATKASETDTSGYCRAVIDQLLRQTVISTLKRAHTSGRPPLGAGVMAPDTLPEIDAGQIEAFVHALGHGPQRAVDEMVESLIQCGGLESLLIDVLPQAEALLRSGADDLASQSTLGQWRLQEMLERLSPRFQSTGSAMSHGTPILLATIEPRMHALRLPLAAECFLRDGWNVTCTGPDDGDRLDDMVAQSWFAVIAVAAEHASIDALAPLLRSVRLASCNPGLRALVISEALARRPDRMARSGADAAAGDLRYACVQAGRLRGLVPR